MSRGAGIQTRQPCAVPHDGRRQSGGLRRRALAVRGEQQQLDLLVERSPAIPLPPTAAGITRGLSLRVCSRRRRVQHGGRRRRPLPGEHASASTLMQTRSSDQRRRLLVRRLDQRDPAELTSHNWLPTTPVCSPQPEGIVRRPEAPRPARTTAARPTPWRSAQEARHQRGDPTTCPPGSGTDRVTRSGRGLRHRRFEFGGKPPARRPCRRRSRERPSTCSRRAARSSQAARIDKFFDLNEGSRSRSARSSTRARAQSRSSLPPTRRRTMAVASTTASSSSRRTRAGS